MRWQVRKALWRNAWRKHDAQELPEDLRCPKRQSMMLTRPYMQTTETGAQIVLQDEASVINIACRTREQAGNAASTMP